MTKKTHVLALVLGASMMFGLSSCFTKGSVVRADKYDSETIVDLMEEEQPLIDPNIAETHHQAKKQVVTKSPLDGEWVIIEAAGKKVSSDDDMPYLIFSDNEGRFYASDGCNIINGDFEYNPNKVITFSNVLSTMRMCPDAGYHKAIRTVLNEGVSVKTSLENHNHETYLVLSSNSNDKLLKLRRHNLEIINGLWEIVEIGNEKIDSDEINLFFDIPEQSIHGNTGCNYFNGTIIIDPDQESSISFSQMGVTMRYCDNAEIERKLLVALEETEKYNLKGKDTLYFYNSKGKELIELKRAQED